MKKTLFAKHACYAWSDLPACVHGTIKYVTNAMKYSVVNQQTVTELLLPNWLSSDIETSPARKEKNWV